MRAIKLTLFSALLIPAALWLLADTLIPDPLTYFSFRGVFVQFSGILAIIAMSIAVVLALRPRWLEEHLHGLDKMYRLHKWLGISALAISVMHWWLAKGTKWMVGWSWLDKPQRKPGTEPTLGFIEQLFHDQRHFAEEIGEWGFYILVAFLLLALIKRFPYRLFQKTHLLIAVVYLVIAYHSLILLKFEYWTQPIGWLMAVTLVAGVVAAVLALSGKVGAGRKVEAEVTGLQQYPELKVLETELTLNEGWPGHAEGQFAFLTIDKREGAHPFTIASDWDPQTHRMRFITKSLGDFTDRMPVQLKVGDRVSVEGPYGRFTFEDGHARQIWVGAGIGITPFIARMNRLARNGDGKTIDLFHPSTDVDETALKKLRADAEAAGVKLHLILGQEGPRVDGEMIRKAVPDWRDASLWFCGPAGFGASLKQNFAAAGLAGDRFHQELFQMR
ncbi:MAG: ferric reductase-like transmembrane domain-containing protein [Candidatus Thiodiazotropha sp.]